MSRPVADYVAMALVKDSAATNPFSETPKNFSGDFAELKSHAEEVCGFSISDAVVRSAIKTLAVCGLIRVTDDNFSGDFYKIHADRFPAFISGARDQLANVDENNILDVLSENHSDFPEASALIRHDIVDDYHELGAVWLDRALAGIKQRVGEDVLDLELPNANEIVTTSASDRIVTIDHNSRPFKEMVLATKSAEDAVRTSNTIDEETKGWVRIHVDAGLEFIKNHKILTAAASALLLQPLLNAYETVAEEPAKEVILAAINIIRAFFGI